MRLMPPDHILPALRRDYGEMRVMIYGELPDFDDLMKQMQALEREINRLGIGR